MTNAPVAGYPAPNTLWRARDGRQMRLVHWIPRRSKPTALMAVLNPGPVMRKLSEQSLQGFGTFLMPEGPVTIPAPAFEVAITEAEISDDELLRRAVTSATTNGARKGILHPRWTAVAAVFCVGSTYARQLCERFKLDPAEMVKR